jgi:hypothetical protein
MTRGVPIAWEGGPEIDRGPAALAIERSSGEIQRPAVHVGSDMNRIRFTETFHGQDVRARRVHTRQVDAAHDVARLLVDRGRRQRNFFRFVAATTHGGGGCRPSSLTDRNRNFRGARKVTDLIDANRRHDRLRLWYR